MKTISSNKLTKVVCLAAILLVLTHLAFAYPPDNAAVLYYRACLLYQPDDAMKKMLTDLSKGKIKLNKKIKKYVKSQHNVINSVVTAAHLSDCDWGYDYSQGFALMMPGLSALRNVGKLILADAKILAAQGKYETSLEHCLTIKKMARHVSDRPFITHLVGIAMDDLANNCIVNILADMPQDLRTLNWLKNQLARIEKMPFSLAICIDYESETVGEYVSKEAVKKLMPFEELGVSPEVAKLTAERVRKADAAFFARNAAYYENHMAHVKAALDLPYAQAYADIAKLSEKPERDVVKNPDATLTAVFAPAIHRVYGQLLKVKNSSNVVRAAVDIYILKAKTGRLPDELPAGAPKDLFSGKDFEYERIDDGFILRCRAKDLLKDKIREYEFKIKN